MTDIDEILKGEFDLGIPNFSKWNPPLTDKHGRVKDQQNRTWFGLKVDWFCDPKFQQITPTERYLWVGCCSLVATNGGVLRQVSVNFVATRLQLRGRSVQTSLRKLAKAGLIFCTYLPTYLPTQGEGGLGFVSGELSPEIRTQLEHIKSGNAGKVLS